jgi:hypothetical protein
MNTLRLFVLALALAFPTLALADSASPLCEGHSQDKQPTTADKSEPKKDQPKEGDKSSKDQPEQKPEGEQPGKS